jgi:hypothetical protein
MEMFAQRELQEEVVGNVGGVDVGQHQQGGVALQRAARHLLAPAGTVERRVAVHLALDSSHGASRRTRSSAWRIFTAEGWPLEPKLECDSSAALGATPKRFMSSAVSTVISASCAASGPALACVSTQVHLPPRQHQPIHAGIVADALAATNNLIDVRQVRGHRRPAAAEHAVMPIRCTPASPRSASAAGAICCLTPRRCINSRWVCQKSSQRSSCSVFTES